MKRLAALLLACLLLTGCGLISPESAAPTEPTAASEIPAYSGSAYVAVNGNDPYFTETDYTTVSFERYSNLDELGRCGVAYACVGQDLMPTEKRGSIGQIKPSGWQTAKYDSVDGKYLYNRCHLIAWSLCGETANRKNLLTGTRYLNETGMLPFEEQILGYIRDTGNHVLYRVTPMYDEEELVCRGVRLEAQSVEDHGKTLCFHVYCYNLQPHVQIDYATGRNQASGD